MTSECERQARAARGGRSGGPNTAKGGIARQLADARTQDCAVDGLDQQEGQQGDARGDHDAGEAPAQREARAVPAPASEHAELSSRARADASAQPQADAEPAWGQRHARRAGAGLHTSRRQRGMAGQARRRQRGGPTERLPQPARASEARPEQGACPHLLIELHRAPHDASGSPATMVGCDASFYAARIAGESLFGSSPPPDELALLIPPPGWLGLVAQHQTSDTARSLWNFPGARGLGLSSASR